MHTGSYVNGQWYHPQSERLVRNANPADPSDVLAEFPSATAADVERAIEAAQGAFSEWKRTPGPERGRVVWRAADIARQRLDEIARTLTREEGKILKEAKGEVLKGISLLEFYAGEGFRMHGKTLPSEARETFTYTIRRPLGVVGLISPWNFPWAIPVWKSAPALVAGNAVVFKPAELTPATASLLAEIYQQAGLPQGVFNMVVGSGSVVGEAIVHSPNIRAVSFTGSNEIGGALYVKAAARGAKVTCEMGGKNAVIVMPDADLEKAAIAIHGGAFGSTGQRCTATSRVIAMPSVKDGLLERLVELARKIKIGSGLDESVDMGPAVDEKQWRTDLNYIQLAKAEGARLVIGGKRPEHVGKGYFVEPTIFDNVSPNMRIFREEIFGPVLAVSTANSLEDALKFANSVEYGLTTSVFTQNIDWVMNFIEEVETGMVHVNEPTIGGEAQLPFGGSKSTGVGEREMAEEGLNFFTELKTVFINYSGKAERLMIR
ncbi:MAG TPA: aldehyde dehydrogenase family protein [Candidatus Binatia bacterium]|jgi:aldehyde dehydrogenase (NAD+)|nr:aldehyde dehydrogenase family protein [Candidatus Binatia bacterium]